MTTTAVMPADGIESEEEEERERDREIGRMSDCRQPVTHASLAHGSSCDEL